MINCTLVIGCIVILINHLNPPSQIADYWGVESSSQNSTAAKCRSYRVAKTHRMPYLWRSFSAKEPCDLWLFFAKWPATKGILWVFATLYHNIVESDMCKGLQAATYRKRKPKNTKREKRKEKKSFQIFFLSHPIRFHSWAHASQASGLKPLFSRCFWLYHFVWNFWKDWRTKILEKSTSGPNCVRHGSNTVKLLTPILRLSVWTHWHVFSLLVELLLSRNAPVQDCFVCPHKWLSRIFRHKRRKKEILGIPTISFQ